MNKSYQVFKVNTMDVCEPGEHWNKGFVETTVQTLEWMSTHQTEYAAVEAIDSLLRKLDGDYTILTIYTK